MEAIKLSWEEFETVQHLEGKWNEYKQSASVTLTELDKSQINIVYKKLYDIKKDKGFCFYCPEEAKDAFTRTFRAYDLVKQDELQRKETTSKRPRIRSAQDLLGSTASKIQD